MKAEKVIFITGTDTGVGKTLLTALLLHHLRQTGCHALAMKPFCSGGRGDVRLLQALQPGELPDAEMNPFYFSQPVAPLVALKKSKRDIRLNDVVKRIKQVQKKCDRLLVEGSGGLLVPLGRGCTVADLISKLNCRTIVVARNRLGTINHTLLTINALRSLGMDNRDLAVVLMARAKSDVSSSTNRLVLAQELSPIPVMNVPFLGLRAASTGGVKAVREKVGMILRKLLSWKE